MIEQKIILGDAVSEMQKIDSETFDLIIADPPYSHVHKNKRFYF